MEGGASAISWLDTLTLSELRDELEKRGLSLVGTEPTLRHRLRQFLVGGAAGPKPAGPGATSTLRPPDLPGEDLDPADFEQPSADSPNARDEAGEQRWWWDSARGQSYLRPPHLELPPGSADRAPRRGRQSPTDVFNILRRWNIGFSGSRGNDAEAFLLRIQEGRRVAPIDDDALLDCLPFFLSGVALTWYRLRRPLWRDWQDFEAAWRRRFGDPDFQYALRNEILRRTQGEHEPVADYLTNMQALLARLSPPWSVSEQLSQAHRNMLPRLQTSIHRREFRSFDELEDLATRIELSHQGASAYRAPPAPEASLFPDLAYRPPKKAARSPANLVAAGIATPGPTKSRAGGRPRARAAAQGLAA